MSIKYNKQMFRFVGVIAVGLLLSSCSPNKGAKESNAIKKTPAEIPQVDVVRVQSLQLNHVLEIPGELKAFQNVPIQAKVNGYISWIGVDRGSKMKTGEKMLTIFCPELEERTKESQAKYSSAVSALRRSESDLESVKSRLLEAKAKLDADTLTGSRLHITAQKMAGAVAINDIDMQDKTIDSDKAKVEAVTSEVKAAESVVVSDRSNVEAAANVVKSMESMRAYLTISAPFDGIVTERNVHVGSMVGPESNEKIQPLIRIQELKVLRLVVAVPEDSVSNLSEGQKIGFSVPAFLGRNFDGVIARPAFAIDSSTRTMPVELNVYNKSGELEPGMFAMVHWRVVRNDKSLFVPASAVGTDLEGTFVNLVKNNAAERVSVQKGQSMGKLIEIVGQVQKDDQVALNATDELSNGLRLSAKLVSGPN